MENQNNGLAQTQNEQILKAIDEFFEYSSAERIHESLSFLLSFSLNPVPGVTPSLETLSDVNFEIKEVVKLLHRLERCK